MDRRVTSTKRDKKGKIVALCNPGESWSPRRTADVIRDITSGKRSYYLQEVPQRKYLRVTAGELQTTAPAGSKNTIESLPLAR
ncbi:MAG TPA: hypothetical protein VGP93_18445 [Polyangiaceae bacterium]|jgi:hypothetical protein|nr:hypothetical protein [Polyangiaceae bacterium]